MFSQMTNLTKKNILEYLETNFANWTSGNKIIDVFIQEKQLKNNIYNDIVLEWIPYNQFNEIKETGKNGLTTVYSAIWKDGPLQKLLNDNYYTRDSNKKVALKFLHNSQQSIDSLINEAKKYPTKHKAFRALYGISQNPNTRDYILVQNNSINLANWISGNEIIDDFIQEKQLLIENYNDVVFEWIPYNQFNEIKETGKSGPITVYSAIWKDGPLFYNEKYEIYTRDSNKEIALKCLYNSQSIDSLINEAKKYPTKHKAFQVLYGISQNLNSGDYLLVLIWTSGNEKIDDFIQKRQLEVNNYNYDNIVLEWIPYNQFNEIKETGKNGLITVYSAIWKDGPLYKRYNESENYTRDSNKEVALKYLHNSQASIDFLVKEAKRYLTNDNAFQLLYGISQNPSTGNYILVQNNSINLVNWISGNEKIDDYIQEMQLKINNHYSKVLEWIPYNQFNEIKKHGKNGLITVYSAVWMDGPLYKKNDKSNYTRKSNKTVALKYLHNSQKSIDSLINEAKKYPIKRGAFQVLYGISQNPDTGDYILVQNNSINFSYWLSGNEKIDDFIQEMQLKINKYKNTVFEYIPYNQFNEIKETGKNRSMTVYSAIWKDGPLYHKKNLFDHYYARKPNIKVALKCLHNSQASIDSLINEAKKYPTKYNKAFQVLFGISQNPDTEDYILVQDNPIWISGNEKIDDFIQKRQLEINKYEDIVFEWIPYNQFDKIKETGNNGTVSLYSAVWMDGPLYYEWNENFYGYYGYSELKDLCERDSYKKVALKCLHNSQSSIDSLLNEVKKYPTKYKVSQKLYATKYKAFQVLYGISQNPDTGNYILVLAWTSGNEKIDDFIQERQLEINNYNYDNIVLEWIPYNQFNEIKETVKNGLITVYSAIWENGPFYKKFEWSDYTRIPYKEVALKCFHNSQASIDSLINEAKKYPIKYKAFQVLYGISQNPITGDYILVLIWTSGNEKIDDFIQERQIKNNNNSDIILEWIPYNKFNEIKKTGKNGLITIYSAIWKDGPLYYQYGEYIRNPYKKVALKCLHNSQASIDFLINEAKKYSTKYNEAFIVLYGISKSPVTGDYILVQNNPLWIMIEWIPYNQFYEIKKTGKNGFITVYLAIWKDGPLHYQYNEYIRDSNKEVILKCLHNSQASVDSLIVEARKYLTKYKAFQVLYGISQNPDTGDYILVQNNSINLTNWISGNEKIDDFVQERQLKINKYEDTVFEWIPYNQFNEIKETGKNHSMTVYSAIWKNGPLHYNEKYSNYIREPNKEVSLKCLHSLNYSIDFLINEANKYSTKNESFHILYGISQNPVTNEYILVQNCSINLINWMNRNEKICNFIQDIQLKINYYSDVIFEWIPYNQFNEIKMIGKNGSITAVYSALWNNGPLHYNKKYSNYTRDSNRKVVLRCLHGSKNIVEFVINAVEKYLTNTFNKDNFVIYGISQNPDTNDYILVLAWTSGNEKIDDFIQEMQLLNQSDVIFEWVPYNQFNKINEIYKNGSISIYSAIWTDGPLHYNKKYDNYARDSNKEVVLRCLHDSQNIIELVINEAKKYLTDTFGKEIFDIYGISQNPNTDSYILVLRNFILVSENKEIDDFIQEKQLKMNTYEDTVFEWIPYNRLNEIGELSKNGSNSIHSAIWKDGPLHYNKEYSNYTRDSNKKVVLEYLHNPENAIDFLINEAKKYSAKIFERTICDIYGISQNPNTNNYILVLSWASGDKKIDCFIQDIQLKINDYDDIVFEWIQYSQFSNIKEKGKGGFSTVYSARWKDGPLEYDADKKIYNRDPNRVIALKRLHNSQNITKKFLNEVKEYSINKSSNILNIYGISQDPDTKEHIIVLNYAKDGNFNHWINENYKYFGWEDKLSALLNIVSGLKEIHQKNLVHRDFHTGNILFLRSRDNFGNYISISDMGLCGEVGNIDETKIYGVMPYVAPEILRRKPYTQSADIYSFGMIMYFVATGRQPFDNHAHDYNLVLDICKKGVRPEITEPEAPRCYIDLMKKCWDLKPNDRPDIFEVNESITSFHKSYGGDFSIVNEEIEIIEMQFKKAEEYRKANLPTIKNYKITTHPQAIYTSRLLNPFTEDLPAEDDDKSQCLDQAI
ncbi:unnamed protein product [Rhizophagus irregularis]|nr:unnamed protein product [Rhizophagus irregularis]